LICAQMTRMRQTAPEALRTLLKLADRQKLDADTPVLYPRL
jgi:hypothetical protein